jgi:hypothetical protein
MEMEETPHDNGVLTPMSTFRRGRPLVQAGVPLLCLGLAACAGMPFATTPTADGSMALLSLRDRVNYSSVPGRDGIVSIDGRAIPGGPARQVHVAPGRRTIGYNCPGWLTTDGAATLLRTFVAGRQYALTCEDPPDIQPVSRVATPR